jgi:hypothetical protein
MQTKNEHDEAVSAAQSEVTRLAQIDISQMTSEEWRRHDNASNKAATLLAWAIRRKPLPSLIMHTPLPR